MILDRSEILKELKEYKELQENWDGYFGKKPSIEDIDNAIKFVNKLDNKCTLPEPCPLSDGGIDLLWESKKTNNYVLVSFYGGEMGIIIRIDDNTIKISL